MLKTDKDSMPLSQLLIESIKIPVANQKELDCVEEYLFALGCGYHNGYKLVQERTSTLNFPFSVIGVTVSKSGRLSICIEGEEDYWEQDTRPCILPCEMN